MPHRRKLRRAEHPEVVNIAQPFVRSGLMLSCWADTGIEEPEDIKGKKKDGGSNQYRRQVG